MCECVCTYVHPHTYFDILGDGDLALSHPSCPHSHNGVIGTCCYTQFTETHSQPCQGHTHGTHSHTHGDGTQNSCPSYLLAQSPHKHPGTHLLTEPHPPSCACSPSRQLQTDMCPLYLQTANLPESIQLRQGGLWTGRHAHFFSSSLLGSHVVVENHEGYLCCRVSPGR